MATKMRQAIVVIIACIALTSSASAQECMICPGGSLRDYWILQIKVIKERFLCILMINLFTNIWQ